MEKIRGGLSIKSKFKWIIGIMIKKTYFYMIALLTAIILGITLPVMFFTGNLLNFQLLFTILFASPIAYYKCISDLRKSELIEEISYLAKHDDLTNIYNRRHFEELFLKTIQKALKSDKEFSLVFFDIDNLKIINDKYGHHVGDEAILTFSDAIKINIRNSDLFARYGGDEFIVVFFNIDSETINKRIKNIKNQLKKDPIGYNGEELIIEFSYGISKFPEDGCEFRKLINIADQRMYLYKNKIKDLIRV